MRKRDTLRIKSIAALIFCMICWGISFVSSKLVLQYIPPVSSAAIRFLFAGMIMFAILPFFKKDSGKKIKLPKELFPIMILSSLTGVTLYFIFENVGLTYTTASAGALVTSSIPVLTLLFEVSFLKRKVILTQIIGVIFSLLGVYFLMGGATGEGRSSEIFGNILVLGSCFCWVLFNYFSIKLQKTADTFSVTAFQNFYGAIFLVPIALFEFKKWQPVPIHIWVHLIFLSLVCSVLCYFLYNFALRGAGSVTAGAFINLIPLVGAIAGIFILGDNLSSLQIFGGVLVLGCIALIMDKK